jgi:hypothetical protein
MGMAYRIDPARRLVIGTCQGVLTDHDIFTYQREVWLRSEVAGYDELIDMSKVERIEVVTTSRLRDLAELSAGMDPPSTATKLAIVAPRDLAFAIGRMYEASRGLNARSTKQVCVFRTMDEAAAWLWPTEARAEPPRREQAGGATM